MTVNRTTLLDLPLPVTGTESGTWGDTTNNGLTEYLDIAIAGALSITSSVTLATTEGDSTGTGIVSTTAQYRTLIVPASGPSANVVITAPSSDRTYHVINRNATYTVQIRAGANSGVTLSAGQSATVAYDSVAGDYVLVGLIGPTVPVSSGGTGATTLTANNVILGNGTSAVQFVAPGTTGNVLTSNGTTWTSSVPGTSAAEIIRVARTSNTALTAANTNNLIDITSGTFTQTFDAAASLGDGWFCYIRNSGTGDITLDPNSSETIDGLTSYVMYPNEVRLVQCDGSALRTIVLQGFSATFTASGTFTKPPGYSAFGGFIWGAGASGARSNSSSVSSRGGGGGGCFPFTVSSTAFGATETITIGAGGAAYTGTSGSTVNAGGDSSIGALLLVKGATSNQGSSVIFNSSNNSKTATSPVGFEGASSANQFSIYGGSAADSTASGDSGNSVYGGAAGAGVNTSALITAAGVSLLGGNGGAASSASNGSNGTAPGGGGGATQTGTQSGAGARGEVRIWGVL